MITIYHLNISRSERILWLAEELGLPYRLERYLREPTMAAPDSLRAIHPLGRAPVIRDGDLVLAESGAIVEYLIHRHGGGRLAVPPESPDYAQYLYWMHFAEGTAMTQYLLLLFMGGALVPGVDQSATWVVRTRNQTASLLQYMDDHLGRQPYFAGKTFTAADIMMAYTYGIVSGFLRLDLAPFKHTQRYLALIGERPAYRKAMELANRTA
jgi:glutathione S-transferase